jgi:hypothetical protein
MPAKKWELDGAARALEDAAEGIRDEMNGFGFADPDSHALRTELDELAGTLAHKAREYRERARQIKA